MKHPKVINSDTGIAHFDTSIDLDNIGGVKTKVYGKNKMGTLGSTTPNFLGSSGREFMGHAGNGTSADECACGDVFLDWTNGGKLTIVTTSLQDGVKFMKYEIVVTIWDGTTKTQETIDIPKILTATTTGYPPIRSTEVELSGTLLAAMTNTAQVRFKIIRTAGHVDDDYNGTAYTEYLEFKYNY